MGKPANKKGLQGNERDPTCLVSEAIEDSEKLWISPEQTIQRNPPRIFLTQISEPPQKLQLGPPNEPEVN